MKSIVVGLECLANVDRALQRAAMLAETFDSKLIVVVAEEIVTTIPLSTIADAEMASPAPEQTRSRQQLIEHTRKLLDARNLNYEIVFPVGDAGHKISAVADEHQADLIVVPAANASFFERWFMRSVSDSVVRSAHRDVLLVADTEEES